MAKKFIAKAIKHPGALRATARRRGLLKGSGPIPRTALTTLEHSKDKTTARRARFAVELRGFNH